MKKHNFIVHSINSYKNSDPRKQSPVHFTAPYLTGTLVSSMAYRKIKIRKLLSFLPFLTVGL